MAEADLLLEIVTPHGVVLSERVEEVIAPSVHGEFGVLPGHLPLLASLSVGLLHYRTGGALNDVAVGRGFAEVIGDKTLVLTDRYMVKENIKVLEVRERLAEVDKQLEAWEGELDDPERQALIEEEQWLAVQLELHGDPPVPKFLEHGSSVDFAGLMPDDDDDQAGAESDDATASAP